MAKFNANGNSTFTIEDSVPAVRNLTAYIKEIDGLEKLYDVLDTTTIADTAETSQVGIQKQITLTIKGDYDNTATTGPHAVFKGIVGGATARAVVVTLEGANTFSFSALCTNYKVLVNNKALVGYEATIVSTGAITIA